MDLKAVLFDVNGTIVDIETDERRFRIYRSISRFLTYQQMTIEPETLCQEYFRLLKEQLTTSAEPHPECDAVAVWKAVLQRQAPLALAALPADKAATLPRFLAELQRGISRKRLEPFPEVRDVLESLQRQYRLGVVTDAQSAYALPELNAVGLQDLFQVVIVSGDHGYRKPDLRLFAKALAVLEVAPEQAIFVGNDMFHDIYGARQAGMKTIFHATTWGTKSHPGVTPDRTIHRFKDLPAAITSLAYG